MYLEQEAACFPKRKKKKQYMKKKKKIKKPWERPENLIIKQKNTLAQK